MRTLSKRRGFTLIELLVVIVIIGILAGIVFKVGAIVAQRTGRAQTLNILEHTKLCLEAYYREYGEYPPVSGVSWEEPGGSAAVPDNWSDVLAAIREQGGEWTGFEVNSKEAWNALFPFLFHDEKRPEWDEYLQHVPAGYGLKSNSVDGASVGVEIGFVSYTNSTHGIHDGWGHSLNYTSAPPYQTYGLWSSGGGMGPIGKDGWSE